jgi:hypothetical protein
MKERKEYKPTKRRDVKSGVFNLLTENGGYMSPVEIGKKLGYENPLQATASVAYSLKQLYLTGKVDKSGTNSRNVKYKIKN